MTQEHFPEFFEQAPTLTVQDALAEFLGAAERASCSIATPMPSACADTPVPPSQARTS